MRPTSRAQTLELGLAWPLIVYLSTRGFFPCYMAKGRSFHLESPECPAPGLAPGDVKRGLLACRMNRPLYLIPLVPAFHRGVPSFMLPPGCGGQSIRVLLQRMQFSPSHLAGTPALHSECLIRSPRSCPGHLSVLNKC